MVSHARLQSYRKNHCIVCCTGLLGCRWHRYKQSTKESRKRDLFWFWLAVLTFLFVTFYFYYWLISSNEADSFNTYLFVTVLDKWVHWYTVMLALTCAVFIYFIILMLFCIFHIIMGHQLYIHPVHLVIVVITLIACICITIVLSEMWGLNWMLIWKSLQITGPFLQIGAVVMLTMVTWLMVEPWFYLSHVVYKVIWMVLYLCVMSGLYISPLFITSPCLTTPTNLPQKPRLMGHRGNSYIAPENTMAAFQRAVFSGAQGFESDVTISYDGVPFLMHDKTLKRTTNIIDLYPEYADSSASSFNYSFLQTLDAGSWFLEKDPFWTAGSLSEEEKNVYSNQTIPTLKDLAYYANHTGKVLSLDIRSPSTTHPYHNQTLNLTLKALQEGGIHPKQVWLYKDFLNDTMLDNDVATNYRQMVKADQSLEDLKAENITLVLSGYWFISPAYTQTLRKNNISTSIWVVNDKWLFSWCWCMGATYVMTDYVDRLNSVGAPVWHLNPKSYLILWICVDVLSAISIITIFIVRRIQLFGTTFSPETIHLKSSTNTALTSSTRSRSMKEKLIESETASRDIFDNDTGRGSIDDGANERPQESENYGSGVDRYKFY